MFPANKIYNVRDWEIWDSVKINSVRIRSTRTICPLGHILIWDIRRFCPKKSDKK